MVASRIARTNSASVKPSPLSLTPYPSRVGTERIASDTRAQGPDGLIPESDVRTTKSPRRSGGGKKEQMDTLILIGVLWVVPWFLGNAMGKPKRRAGFMYGFLLGWLGILILALLPPLPEQPAS